jgi:hypothetical protein
MTRREHGSSYAERGARVAKKPLRDLDCLTGTKIGPHGFDDAGRKFKWQLLKLLCFHVSFGTCAYVTEAFLCVAS